MLKKENPERMGTVLFVSAELVRQAAILLQPVIPAGAAQLLDLLDIAQEHRDFASLGADYRLTPGTALPTPQGVFPRLSMMEDGADS